MSEEDFSPSEFPTQAHTERAAQMLTTHQTGNQPLLPHTVRADESAIEPHRHKVRYTPEIAARLLDRFEEGESLHAISKIDGMPNYATISQWIKNNSEFREAIEVARLTRALAFEDKAIMSAEEAVDMKGCSADRLRFDAYTWAASVNNPARYGKKTTVEGNPDKPLTFIIKTGFPEPVGYQAPPTLGPDGIIIEQAAEKVVESIVVDPNETLGGEP